MENSSQEFRLVAWRLAGAVEERRIRENGKGRIDTVFRLGSANAVVDWNSCLIRALDYDKDGIQLRLG